MHKVRTGRSGFQSSGTGRTTITGLVVGTEFQPAKGEMYGKDVIMAGNVIELTDATFDEIVHSVAVPVLVDFWAPWCGPCKMMGPIIEEVAGEYEDKAKICKLNTDEARDSAVEFGINAIPTTILFKGGQIQKKWVGLTGKKDLMEAIDGLL